MAPANDNFNVILRCADDIIRAHAFGPHACAAVTATWFAKNGEDFILRALEEVKAMQR